MLSATAVLFRYVSAAELQVIKQIEEIRSYSGETLLTPDLLVSAVDAQERPSLAFVPEYRIGPIACDVITFDGQSLRRAAARFGHSGGGWEISTMQPIPYGTTERL